jgi:hypothetical protein
MFNSFQGKPWSLCWKLISRSLYGILTSTYGNDVCANKLPHFPTSSTYTNILTIAKNASTVLCGAPAHSSQRKIFGSCSLKLQQRCMWKLPEGQTDGPSLCLRILWNTLFSGKGDRFGAWWDRVFVGVWQIKNKTYNGTEQIIFTTSLSERLIRGHFILYPFAFFERNVYLHAKFFLRSWLKKLT